MPESKEEDEQEDDEENDEEEEAEKPQSSKAGSKRQKKAKQKCKKRRDDGRFKKAIIAQKEHCAGTENSKANSMLQLVAITLDQTAFFWLNHVKSC